MGFFLRRKQIIEMQEELTKFTIQQMGFGPVGEIRMLTPGSGNAHNYFRDKIYEANLHASIYEAERALVTGRNDVLLVTPGSHAWKGDSNTGSGVLTWDKENTHMLGMEPAGLGGYCRARFSHTGYSMANFMTVSGAGNKFKNLRWMHGSATGAGADVTCITVTGAGNKFEDCAFAGPNDATQSADADYAGVVLDGATQNHFKNCMFGTANAIQRSGANCMLKFSGAGGLNVFENCVFRSNSLTATDCFFINFASTEQSSPAALFLNCHFVNHKAAASSNMAYGITDSSHANDTLFFDGRCTFSGVASIIAAASEAKIVVGTGGAYLANAVGNLKSTTADEV